jgi:hypothetical protein
MEVMIFFTLPMRATSLRHLTTLFYVGHSGVIKVHKVNNNRHSQQSRFCIIHGFNHRRDLAINIGVGQWGWKNQLMISGASFYEVVMLERGGGLVLTSP